jgi:nitrate reductase beta subunit
MPMVWYVPPLSPVVDALRETGNDAEDADNLFGALASLRIPVEYLAELFTAGDPGPVLGSLATLAAMRSYMRERNLGGVGDESIAEAVALTGDDLYELYRLLAIAKYEDRYVIPKAHSEVGRELEEMGCSVDFSDGSGKYSPSGPFGESSGRPVPVAVENFHAMRTRQHSDGYVDPSDPAAKVSLLNWDGAVPLGMPGVRGDQPGESGRTP